MYLEILGMLSPLKFPPFPPAANLRYSGSLHGGVR
jgi:hypothetical protein